MTGYGFSSTAFDSAEGWLEVWPVGEGRGRGPLASWPTFVSYLKAAEYLQDAGRLRKLRKAADLQTELERRYAVIQREAFADCPEGLAVAVQLPPFPEGTAMSKHTVRADVTAGIGVLESPAPMSRHAALAAAEETAVALRADGVTAVVSERRVQDRCAVVLAATTHDEDGTLRTAQRTVMILIEEHPVHALVMVRTGAEDVATRLDAILDRILDGAEILVP